MGKAQSTSQQQPDRRAERTRFGAVVVVLLLLLAVTAGDGGAADEVRAELAGASSKAGAPTGKGDAQIKQLTSEVSSLRERLTMARQRADRADASVRTKINTAVVRAVDKVRAEKRALADRSARTERRLRGDLRAVKTRLRARNATIARLRQELALAQAQEPAPPSDEGLGGGVDVGSDGCHTSYVGACVPIVSDVDCEGGDGDGPEYVGFVTVVGPDEYDLDGDGDGFACDL